MENVLVVEPAIPMLDDLDLRMAEPERSDHDPPRDQVAQSVADLEAGRVDQQRAGAVLDDDPVEVDAIEPASAVEALAWAGRGVGCVWEGESLREHSVHPKRGFHAEANRSYR